MPAASDNKAGSSALGRLLQAPLMLTRLLLQGAVSPWCPEFHRIKLGIDPADPAEAMRWEMVEL